MTVMKPAMIMSIILKLQILIVILWLKWEF